MSPPRTAAELIPLIQELYRPSLRGHWQRRVINRVRRWLGREDAELYWTNDEEEAALVGDRLLLPDRIRAPRWLGFEQTLSRETLRLAQMLLPHLATVASLMEVDADGGAVPPRWGARLTQRQSQVALRAAHGASNEDIAADLGIAPRTVARLLQETFRRLEVQNRAALAAECALGRPPTPFLDAPSSTSLSEDD